MSPARRWKPSPRPPPADSAYPVTLDQAIQGVAATEAIVRSAGSGKVEQVAVNAGIRHPGTARSAGPRKA